MKAYTFIELMMAIMLLAVILLGGTAIFYQSLRSSGLSDVDLNMSSALRGTLSSMEKDIRFARAEMVGTGIRDDCLVSGNTGYTGNSLTVLDIGGAETVYSLINDKIASTSAQTGSVTYLTPDSIKIKSLSFTWYCRGGVNDKINIEVDASVTVLGSGLEVTRNVSTEVNMLNSGIN